MALIAPNEARRERERLNAELGDLAARYFRRRMAWALLGWMAWYALGAAIVAYSFSVDGQRMGDLFFWLGLCAGNVGAFLHVVFVLVRATERGDL
jgi:hypothetical protein